MSEKAKRNAILETINTLSSLNLTRPYKDLFHWFLFEPESLEFVNIEENMFFYALGRVVECNIEYITDPFGHAENIDVNIRYLVRDENGEDAINDIDDILAVLQANPPISKKDSITIVFNYINNSVPDEDFWDEIEIPEEVLLDDTSLQNEMGQAFIAEIENDTYYKMINNAEKPTFYNPKYVKQSQHLFKTKENELFIQNNSSRNKNTSYDAASLISNDFFENLEKLNMERLWDNALNRALEDKNYTQCEALQEARLEARYMTLDVQKQLFSRAMKR